MSYLDEHGLARYDGLIKNWVTLKSGTVDGADPLLNWQKTGTAGAVTFSPLPAAPIDPVVNFLFTETGPASGTKGPDNPSTITGVSSAKVTRCGKNLCPNIILGNNNSDITVTSNSDGTFTFNGTVRESTAFYAVLFNTAGSTKQWPNFIKHDTAYTFSLYGTFYNNEDPENVEFKLYRTYNNGSAYGGADVDIACGETATWTSPSASETGIIMRLIVEAGTTLSNAKVGLQIEEGTTATAFEPYDGADYTIDLGSTYYGGSVDLSTGVMTVTWERDVCTSFASVDAISTNTVAFRYNASRYHQIAGGMLYDRLACNRFPVVDDSSDAEHCRFSGAGVTNTLRFYINKTRLDVSSAADPSSPTNAEWVAAANTWLASHPTSLVYILDTSYTVPLTPTQIYSLSQLDPYTPRLNTVYSDQVSVQVGYPKSPQATQNELTSAIVSLGGNV